MRITIESEYLPNSLSNCESSGRKHIRPFHSDVRIDTSHIIFSDLNE